MGENFRELLNSPIFANKTFANYGKRPFAVRQFAPVDIYTRIILTAPALNENFSRLKLLRLAPKP